MPIGHCYSYSHFKLNQLRKNTSKKMNDNSDNEATNGNDTWTDGNTINSKRSFDSVKQLENTKNIFIARNIALGRLLCRVFVPLRCVNCFKYNEEYFVVWRWRWQNKNYVQHGKNIHNAHYFHKYDKLYSVI